MPVITTPSDLTPGIKETIYQPAPDRLESLDVFRGLTIASMIIVNQLPGDQNYAPLEHAPWNGWTHTDLIFPFFLFIVGVSMVLSFSARQERGSSKWRLLFHTVRRAIIIYGIGFFLAAFPFYEGILSRVRIMGVLQRIALVYLLAGIIYLVTNKKVRGALVVLLLVIYFLLMKFYPVPGIGPGVLTPAGNLAGYIDRMLMPGHLWSVSKIWDPEGLLSTMGAMATCLIGTFVGEALRDVESWRRRVVALVLAAVAGICFGYAWDPWFPINKNLWTSSYVLFTAGYAMALLAALHLIIDVAGLKRVWTRPFIWLGANPILAFTLSTFTAKYFFILYKVPYEGHYVSAAGYIYDRWFQHMYTDERNSSLAFVLAYLLIWIVVCGVLYRQKIFVRI